MVKHNIYQLFRKSFKVTKKSGKPFKSGNKKNSVYGIAWNELDPKKRLGFVFKEDDSVVNIDKCRIEGNLTIKDREFQEYFCYRPISFIL